MNENLKLAKQLVSIAKELTSDNAFKNIGNQFKSLSREINKPNNTKSISKGLNDLSKSFSRMPKAASEDKIDIASELKKIAEELLSEGE